VNRARRWWLAVPVVILVVGVAWALLIPRVTCGPRRGDVVGCSDYSDLKLTIGVGAVFVAVATATVIALVLRRRRRTSAPSSSSFSSP